MPANDWQRLPTVSITNHSFHSGGSAARYRKLTRQDFAIARMPLLQTDSFDWRAGLNVTLTQSLRQRYTGYIGRH